MEVTVFRLPLLRIESSRVRASLDVVVDEAGGDLVLEGRDFGRAVEEVWGGDEYEYWVTVKRKHRDALLVLLLRERFGDGADALVAWLGRRRIHFSGSGRVDGVDVRPDRVVHIATSGGVLTLPEHQYDRATLALLKDLFDSKRFEHDAAFRAWLTDNDVSSEFFSYT